GNSNRQDHASRRHFRVFAGERTICHLIIGPDLKSLSEHARAFAEACPEIACRHLFFCRREEWDYLGIESFDGRDLDSLAQQGRLTASNALKHAAKIVTALERTLQPSTKEAATKELETLFARVRSLPM